MARYIVLPIEGILRDPVGGHLLPDGHHLYRALSANYEVILTTTMSNRTWVKEWLAMEGIFKYAQIVYPDYLSFVTDNEATNIRRHLSLQGYDIEFWICNDAALARDLLVIGEPVMLIVRPQYALPEWHPDTPRGAPKWDELVQRTLIDKATKLADIRTEIEEP
jgi:hypothetical protein